LKPELDEICQEVNGFDLATAADGHLRRAQGRRDHQRRQLDLHRLLSEAGNLSKRRAGIQDPKKNDPTGMGFYHGWGWSWPLKPARAVQPRLGGSRRKPWDPARVGIEWDPTEKKWKGDVPDYPPTMEPRSPKAWGPFIMNGEGVGRLFSNSMLDGPFPEHYEPVESPVENPLHPKQSESPVCSSTTSRAAARTASAR